MPSFLDAERFSERIFFFRVQKIGWKFLGFWPGIDHVSSFQMFHAVLSAFVVFFYGAFQLNDCFVNRNNLFLVLETLTPVVSQLPSATKILIIVLVKRKGIKKVLDQVKESFYFDRTKESIKINGEVSRISFVLAATIGFFGNLTILFYWLLPAVKDSYRLIKGLERNYDLPLKAS